VTRCCFSSEMAIDTGGVQRRISGAEGYRPQRGSGDVQNSSADGACVNCSNPTSKPMSGSPSRL
jgi:hypothetical protein